MINQGKCYLSVYDLSLPSPTREHQAIGVTSKWESTKTNTKLGKTLLQTMGIPPLKGASSRKIICILTGLSLPPSPSDTQWPVGNCNRDLPTVAVQLQKGFFHLQRPATHFPHCGPAWLNTFCLLTHNQL